MVGAPGSGKSTVASSIASSSGITKAAKPCNTIVISGDDIRAELYGNADIQGNYTEIHDKMLKILEENVGRVVVLDGTHYRAKYRKDAITLLQSFGYSDIRAIVVNPPLETCLRQNANRSRNVPEHVIEKMHTALQASLRSIDTEGFSHISYVLQPGK